jgi:hypothetical protein
VALPECPRTFIPNTVKILLELITDPAPEVARAASAWFSRSAAHVSRVIEPLIRVLIDVLPNIDEPSMTFVPFYTKQFNADQIEYCLKQLNLLLTIGGSGICEALNVCHLNHELASEFLNDLPPKYRIMEASKGRDLYHLCLITRLSPNSGDHGSSSAILLRRKYV